MELTGITGQFNIGGTVKTVTPFGSGHIHQTYAVSLHGHSAPSFLLQKINTFVFRDVEGMMHNISRVTTHLKRMAGSDPGYLTLELIKTISGRVFLEQDGEAWRMYKFLDNLESYDILPTDELVLECGKGYGRFLTLLSDLPADSLAVTIPRFHDISYRLEQLDVARSSTGEDTNGLYDLVQEMAEGMVELDSREVPVRVTHNDTKSNNILFTKDGTAACVVDLDTVMPGKIWYDAGDSLRSILSDSGEDDDANELSVRLDYYDAYMNGFLQETHAILSPEEWSCLPLSGAYMAFIMGVRFLTDHLNGDVYYKTGFRGQNLNRAGNQLALAYKLRGLEEELTGRLESIRTRLLK